MRTAIVALLVALALCAPLTHAWGNVGHAAIATVAQKLIAAKTWTGIQMINGQDVSLASVASQADDYGRSSGGKWSSPLHYVNMPDGATRYSDEIAICPNQACVTNAIRNYTTITQKMPRTPWPYTGPSSLPSPVSMLVHFIGDLHQPLHAGWGRDRGGNTLTCTWFGSKSELHKVWDSGIISHAGYNVESLSTALLNIIRQDPARSDKWWKETNVAVWADESFQVVRTTAYDFGSAVGNMALGTEYFNLNIQPCMLRLAAGAVRLAATLDRVFANGF